MPVSISGSGSITGVSTLTQLATLDVTGAVSVGGTLTYEDVTNIDAIGIITARSGIVGDLTGNVTGNVTGNITGDITGTITGTTTIAGISSSISDTAVDVFIYDTSKDSDGGAWRKRIQHTSWYNETLGTATRGSRKEFPTVAVIVAESNQVTIYDGDDSDLPMWMVFNQATNYVIYTTITSVYMLNGKLVVGTNPNSSNYYDGGIKVFDFISEFIRGYSYSHSPYNYNLNISQRNANNANALGVYSNTNGTLVNPNVNDVAMTVLPNAPTDSATGLPVPTIAAATNAGISVVTDSGSVYDLTTGDVYDHYSKVEFGDNNRLYYTAYDTQVLYSRAIPTADHNYTAYNTQNTNRVMFPTMDHGGFPSGHPVRLLGTNGGTNPLLIVKNKASGSNETSYAPSGFGIRPGLTFIDEGETNPTSIVAYATTSYNTGWMHGNIKGAFLSDTDTTNVSPSSNLVSNGDFADTNLSNYFTLVNSDGNGGAEANSAPYVNGSNQVVMGNSAQLKASYNLVAGRVYKLSYDCVNKSISQQRLGIYVPSGGSVNFDDSIAAGGTNTYYYTSPLTGSTVIEWRSRGGGWGTFDNFTITESTELDRSLNNKGLAVYGTVTKSPVATGADLVAYSTGSNGTYLEQPYNSGLDYGTGDMYYSMWVYANSSDTFNNDCYIFERTSISDTNNRRIEARMTTSTRLEVYSNGQTLDNNVTVPANAWYKLDIIRRSSEAFVYINGEYRSSTTGLAATLSLTDTSATLIIGNRGYFVDRNYAFPSNSKIALFRTGAGTVSAAQVKKMYEDEKHLFQENAKCTLYGSSDEVTALAYDEVIDRLHVGTSSGRSDFQGLRRINNTTTAVTTAISAHDEFIVEQ